MAEVDEAHFPERRPGQVAIDVGPHPDGGLLLQWIVDDTTLALRLPTRESALSLARTVLAAIEAIDGSKPRTLVAAIEAIDGSKPN